MGILYLLGAVGAALLGFAFVGRRPPGDPGAAPGATAPPIRPGDPGPDRPGERGEREASGTQGETISAIDAHPASGISIAPPTLREWGALLAPGCAAGGIQLPYALRWIDLESGGNPCTVGYPAARGPDGMPRELGIAQLYNPDDLDVLSPALTGSEMRAYCVPGDQHEIVFRGRVIRGFSQAMSRPMLPEEMRRQALSAIQLIGRCMVSASRDLAGVGATWSRTGRDYWALVKLQHGLPAISHQGLPAVTRQLGRPPRGWSEFRTSLADIRLEPDVEKKYRDDFPKILDNAARCAAVISEGSAA